MSCAELAKLISKRWSRGFSLVALRLCAKYTAESRWIRLHSPVQAQIQKTLGTTIVMLSTNPFVYANTSAPPHMALAQCALLGHAAPQRGAFLIGYAGRTQGRRRIFLRIVVDRIQKGFTSDV